jgi:hypothetical protein
VVEGLMGRPFLYRCPTTDLTVQATMEVDPPADSSTLYRSVECTACSRLHFVNLTTLKLLSEELDDQR